MKDLKSTIHIRAFISAILSFTIAMAQSQKYQTKEIQIAYTNGVKVFEVCITNPTITFSENNEYYWFSDISGSPEIKRTQGGFGGSLLHGKERFYKKNGNLLFERTYNLGLLNGESKYWDSTTGRLNEIHKHVNGNLTYRKIKVEGGWFEDIGLILHEGYKRRNYDELNNITTESIYKDRKYFVKDFYKYSNKIKHQYSTLTWCDTCYRGKIISFYENGNKKIEGQYSDSLTNIKVGLWKWYKETGTLDSQEIYKEEIQRWPNGEWKLTGGYYFDPKFKKWLKIGKWDYYDENGKYLYNKKFDLGIEVKE